METRPYIDTKCNAIADTLCMQDNVVASKLYTCVCRYLIGGLLIQDCMTSLCQHLRFDNVSLLAFMQCCHTGFYQTFSMVLAYCPFFIGTIVNCIHHLILETVCLSFYFLTGQSIQIYDVAQF